MGLLDDDGHWRPVRKRTSLQAAVQDAMTLQCQGDHQHCALEGSAPRFGARTRYMEEYQPAMASTLAAALSLDEPPQVWEHVFATEEQKEVTSKLVQLRATTKQDAIRVVQRLHRNLGHPAPSELTDLLAARGASESILQALQAARTYVCTACAKYKKPNGTAPAASTSFNQILQADVFWIRQDGIKHPVMTMIDLATRYVSAYLLKSEQTADYVKAHGAVMDCTLWCSTAVDHR